MTKHTPGPWKTWSHNGCLVVDSNGLQVADTFHGIPVLHRSDAECRENARLIAAAPDLLKQRDELMAAVQYAADVFAEYVALHKAKGAAGAEKAQSNQRHLQVMLDAIAKDRGQP